MANRIDHINKSINLNDCHSLLEIGGGFAANIHFLLSNFTNLKKIGSSGMFKYNNQDHAIATGLYAARNVISGKNLIDIWKINSEGIYQEGEVKND